MVLIPSAHLFWYSSTSSKTKHITSSSLPWLCSIDQRTNQISSPLRQPPAAMARGNAEGTCCRSLFSFLFGAGFVILIYWAIFQPHHIRVDVDAATLSGNNNNTTLSYHLAANLSLYNPSLRVDIYYDALYATLRFHDALLGPANDTSPTEFYQQRKSRDLVQVEFDGRAVAVAGDVAGEFVKEKGERVVNVEVWVDVRVRYRFASIKIRQKPRIRCLLRIPAKAENGGNVDGVLGAREQCSVKY